MIGIFKISKDKDKAGSDMDALPSSSGDASSVSARGSEIASLPSQRDLFENVLANLYDPEKNIEGVINIGTAENVAHFT